MLANSHGERLVVEGVLLFDCARKGIVRDDGGANSRHVEVNVFEVFDLVVQRGFACHAIDRQGSAAYRNCNVFWRLFLRGMQLLSVLVVSEVVFRLHHGLALFVEEGVSLLVALLPDGRVEHQLAIGILPLFSFFVEHGGGRQLHDRVWTRVLVFPFLVLWYWCCGRLRRRQRRRIFGFLLVLPVSLVFLVFDWQSSGFWGRGRRGLRLL